MSTADLVRLATSFGLSTPGGAGAAGYFSGTGSFRSEDDIARRSYNSGDRFVRAAKADVTEELQAVLDKCLQEKGYRRLALTKDQQTKLAKLKRHTSDRQQYLYELGSSLSVIKAQEIADEPVKDQATSNK